MKKIRPKEIEPIFEGPGKCDFCTREKEVHLVFHVMRWRDICKDCEKVVAPKVRRDARPGEIRNVRAN